jgi:hypothetical protein
MLARFDVDENVQMEIKVPGKDDLILVKSNMMDQFSISANGENHWQDVVSPCLYKYNWHKSND